MTSLSQAEINALLEALDDEYRAWSTYDQVLRDFGDVRPFINIREAEARHIETLLEHYGGHRQKVASALGISERTLSEIWEEAERRHEAKHG